MLNETAVAWAAGKAAQGNATKIIAAALTALDWVTRQLVSLIDKTPANPAQARIMLILTYLLIAYVLFTAAGNAAVMSKKIVTLGAGALLIVLVFSAIFKAA